MSRVSTGVYQPLYGWTQDLTPLGVARNREFRQTIVTRMAQDQRLLLSRAL